MRRRPVYLATLILVLMGAAPTTRISQQRLNDAIKALRAEFDKAKSVSELREQPNYFSAPDQISPDALLDALEDQISRDSVRQSYVKWQLLSAVQAFDEKSSTQAIAIYRDAPACIARPGISDEDRQRLDRLAKIATKTDVYALTKRLEAEVARNLDANRFILAYRDELYCRLPKNHATLLSALEDLFERFQAGLEIKPELANWMEDARRWSVSSEATPAQLSSVAQAIERMLLEDGPQYYAEADFADGAVTWKKKRDSLRRSPKLKNLATELREQAARPTGGLKFKDE